MPGKSIFKEGFSCCSSYRLRKILSFPSSASIVGEREERQERDTRVTTSATKSVDLVVSPLNALMYDQISKLRARGVEAAVLGVRKGNDTDSPVISQ